MVVFNIPDTRKHLVWWLSNNHGRLNIQLGYVAILGPNVYIGSKSYQTRVLQLSIITLIKADDKKDQRNDRHIIFIRFSLSLSLSHYYYYHIIIIIIHKL